MDHILEQQCRLMNNLQYTDKNYEHRDIYTQFDRYVGDAMDWRFESNYIIDLHTESVFGLRDFRYLNKSPSL